MKSTVYNQLKEVEEMDIKLRGLNSPSEIDVAELQKTILGRYEENQVLYDAIRRRQTIEESLEELGRVNKGIRKILPRRKNKGHNERLEQLGELVSEPLHLLTSGIFAPDNLITAGVEVGSLAFVGSYLMARYLFVPNPDLSPEQFQQVWYASQVIAPRVGMVGMGLLAGIGATLLFRSGSLPIKGAKYLDEKIVEFYE